MPNQRRGISVKKFIETEQALIQEIIEHNPNNAWHSVGDPEDPWLIWRNGKTMGETRVCFANNNIISENSSYLHHTEALKKPESIKICNCMDLQLIYNYDLDIGMKYWLPDYKVPMCLSGDESSQFENMLKGSNSMNVLLLKPADHVPGLHHNVCNLVILMIAVKDLEHYDEQIVIDTIQNIGTSLDSSGYMKSYNAQYDFWTCWQYIVVSESDWPYDRKFMSRTANVTSNYNIWECLKISGNGMVTNIRNNREEQMAAITGINVATYTINDITEAHIPNYDTYTLMTPPVHQYVAEQVTAGVNNVKNNDINNNKGDKWDDPQYEHKQRLSFASALGFGILYATTILTFLLTFDTSHFRWVIIVHTFVITVMLEFIVWGWPVADILLPIKIVNSATVYFQAITYFGTNKSRSAFKLWKLSTNGYICDKILLNLPYFFILSIHIASCMPNVSNASRKIQLTILTIGLYFTLLIREIFSIMEMSQYKLFDCYGRSILVKQMIDKTNLAIYIVYHLANVYVK